MYRPQDLSGFVNLQTDLKVAEIRAKLIESIGSGFESIDLEKAFSNDAIVTMALAHGLDAVFGNQPSNNDK